MLGVCHQAKGARYDRELISLFPLLLPKEGSSSNTVFAHWSLYLDRLRPFRLHTIPATELHRVRDLYHMK